MKNHPVMFGFILKYSKGTVIRRGLLGSKGMGRSGFVIPAKAGTHF